MLSSVSLVMVMIITVVTIFVVVVASVVAVIAFVAHQRWSCAFFFFLSGVPFKKVVVVVGLGM